LFWRANVISSMNWETTDTIMWKAVVETRTEFL